MRSIACFAATALLVCAPLGLARAQNAPDPATPPATTAPAAPADAAPAAQTPPANAAAPASATPPAADAPRSDTTANPPAKANEKAAEETAPKSNAPKSKKKAVSTTRRREIEKSIESGTVPSRYRSSVPKEYQQYIPFSKD